MTRREARETLFSLIYEMQMQLDLPTEELLTMAETVSDLPVDDYVRNGLDGVVAHLADIDAAIETYAKGWKISRLSGVTLAILRLCIYELRYCNDVPANVAMNEAIELAKKFDDDNAPAFINGIVNAAAKDSPEKPEAEAELSAKAASDEA